MEPNRNEEVCQRLPVCAVEYIRRVTKKIRYRRHVRAEVGAELTAHFEDALKDCANAEEREAKARELIEQFGDARLLAILCRRAKKRCRPLWQKAFIRTVQAIGVFLLYLGLCSLPLFLGRPAIRVNYAEWLNEHWRPNDKEARNAATYYGQAARLYVKPPSELGRKVETTTPKLDDYNDVELRLLASWLDENAPALAKLRQGAKTPHYWPIYDTNESELGAPGFMGGAMDALTKYRHLAFALNHESACEIHRGNLQDGLDICFVIRRMGRHLQDRGVLLEQLVGIALENLAYSRMLGILYDEPNVPVQILTCVRDELLVLRDEHRSVISLDGEKAFWHDAIQRTFTDDGKGGGHALRHGFPYAAGDWRDNLLGIFAFHYPDRRETIVMVERFFEGVQKSLTVMPGQEDSTSASNGQDEAALGNMLLSLLPSAYSRAGQQVWALKTHEAAAIVSVAILSYKDDKGKYPASLGELLDTGYLSKPPQDPFGQGPLVYEVTTDGFLLYSCGENLTDDGGVQGVDKHGKPRMWSDNGDWVFWPVPQIEK